MRLRTSPRRSFSGRTGGWVDSATPTVLQPGWWVLPAKPAASGGAVRRVSGPDWLGTPPSRPSTNRSPPTTGPDDRIADLRHAIASLPEKERLALHAFYLQEQDAEQACTVLGLSRSGLYRVLAVARRRLKGLLSKQETSS